MRAEQISLVEWNTFLRGSVTDFREKENKADDYLTQKQWYGLWGL